MRIPRALVLLLAASLLGLAACTGGGSAPSGVPASDSASAPASASSGGAAASDGTAAPCPTAPAPNPADPPGWPVPGTAATPSVVPGTAATPSVVPVIVSSEQVCGPNRFLFAFLDASNNPVSAPDRTASVAFYDLGRDPSTPVSSATGTFVWAIEGVRGLYETNVTFPEAGEWGAEFTTAPKDGGPETVRMRFEVKPTGTTLGIGAKAPSVRTPTTADVGGDLAKLSSDQHPDPAFYTTSVDAALAAGGPFVLIFATPAFCTSGQCGPTLDVVKGVAAKEPGTTFINVEPYRLQYADGRLQPILDANGQLQPVDATNAYGLVSEPWIFVVDRDGRITASFEGVVSAAELTAAVDAAK